MRALPASVNDEELKALVREWVGLLGEEDYHAAFDLLSPEVPPGSGSLGSQVPQWTPSLLEAVIHNGGFAEPLEGMGEWTCRVVPLRELEPQSVREEFEAYLRVDRLPFRDMGRSYLGGIHVDLPLDYSGSIVLGDLTARFYLSPHGDEEMALVLLDIHMM